MPKAIVNGSVFDGTDVLVGHAVVIDDTNIVEVISENDLSTSLPIEHDLDGGYLIPGFLDVQVNGGGGVLFNDEPTVDGIRAIGDAHRAFGTTGFLPTLITTDFDTMRAAIEAVDDAIAQHVPGVLGIHLEGPFLNSERKGAHDDSQFQRIDEQAIQLLTSLKNGSTIVTLAPELTTPGVISTLANAGVVVCAGHSAADHVETQTALDAGVTGFTHLFNAMTPMQNREPGMVGTAIADNKSWFGIIADGFHVHPVAFQVAIMAKCKGGAVLVTDAMPPVGSDRDSFELGGETIRSVNGRCINAAGSLAGSDLTMIDAVDNAAAFANIDWFEAVRMASLYPAAAIGLDHQYGRIQKACTANLVALDKHKNVIRTWINGDCI